ncbi:MAG TPA: MmcB family DNA repair protein [Hyphomicrobiaceae bacterium]|nr:MmcB family DNA repair protein [Hyphomicrobiaceae bacterium]
MVVLRGYPDTIQDGRQSQVALDICRGVARLLKSQGLATVCEVTLANGRRADVVGLSANGAIWIVEIKSSIEDFRSDQKWPQYRAFCDRLLFAVSPEFPSEILPTDTGLIIADRYGGEQLRAAPEHKLTGARRKAMTLRVARIAALRLQGVMDPDGGFAEQSHL